MRQLSLHYGRLEFMWSHTGLAQSSAVPLRQCSACGQWNHFLCSGASQLGKQNIVLQVCNRECECRDSRQH